MIFLLLSASFLVASVHSLHRNTYIHNHHAGLLKIPIYDHSLFNYYAVTRLDQLPEHVQMLGHIIPNKYYLVGTDKYSLAPLDSIPQVPREQILFKRDQVEERSWTKLDPAYSSITDPLFIKQWHLANRESIGNDINPGNIWQQGILFYNIKILRERM
jgi:hypothetical protein